MTSSDEKKRAAKEMVIIYLRRYAWDFNIIFDTLDRDGVTLDGSELVDILNELLFEQRIRIKRFDSVAGMLTFETVKT